MLQEPLWQSEQMTPVTGHQYSSTLLCVWTNTSNLLRHQVDIFTSTDQVQKEMRCTRGEGRRERAGEREREEVRATHNFGLRSRYSVLFLHLASPLFSSGSVDRSVEWTWKWHPIHSSETEKHLRAREERNGRSKQQQQQQQERKHRRSSLVYKFEVHAQLLSLASRTQRSVCVCMCAR